MIILKDISITMGLGEMIVEARMVQQDVIYEFGVFFSVPDILDINHENKDCWIWIKAKQ